MKLDVLPQTAAWYADGLRFTCTQCGNCCTGEPGYIYASEEELQRLADFLNLSVPQVLQRYCRKVGSRVSFKEKRGAGGFDCIFLQEVQATRRPAGADRDVLYTKRICSIYSVRPLQCRTWPFWPGILQNRHAWDQTAKRCPGMNHGERVYSSKEIERIRDATDWPT
jgi:Fe-S-cluster containining protein